MAKADYLLIPMDRTQTNHIKAYGVAFQALKNENTVQWLLNYRGGSFLMADNETNQGLLKNAGVSFEKRDDKKTQDILNEVLAANNGMNLVAMNHVPKIAVYAPNYNKPYDDAVTLALSYAGIEYSTIYDREVMKQDLDQYDWIHLHHEDFTGQYNKWQYMYAGADWFKNEKALTEATAKEFGFNKAAQLKLAVAKKLRSYVENGGQLFAMCAGTDKLDIALAAEGIDIAPTQIDGDPADAAANTKLNFNNTFAFQNFTVDMSEAHREYSNITVPNEKKTSVDRFNLQSFDAKKNLISAMLVQNHESSIKEFKGSSTAYYKAYIKPMVEILGSTATDVKYLDGQRGKGHFTFYAGHDPEDFEHLVGDKAGNPDTYKQSAGYRLILNNVLSQTVTAKTLGVADVSQTKITVYPNPFTNSMTVELQSEDAKQARLTLYNLNGQVVLSDELRNESGSFKKQYSTAGLAAGLYIVEVSNAKGSVGKTLVSKVD